MAAWWHGRVAVADVAIPMRILPVAERNLTHSGKQAEGIRSGLAGPRILRELSPPGAVVVTLKTALL